MRIANWNVNSVRTRVDRIVAALARLDIDVLLVQETKCKDKQFPFDAFPDYEIAHHGLNQWNGVAILSRVGLANIQTSFPHQPGFAKDPKKPQNLEARAISADCGGVRVWSLYVPNGRAIADRHYDYKLRWLDALARHVEDQAGDPEQPSSQPLVLGGDFNIAPADANVWDITAFIDHTHVTEAERQAFAGLIEAGLTVTSPTSGYSYWDYKAGRFPKNEGMLIDFQLARGLHATGSFIDVSERSGAGASDHAPVVVDYDYDAPIVTGAAAGAGTAARTTANPATDSHDAPTETGGDIA